MAFATIMKGGENYVLPKRKMKTDRHIHKKENSEPVHIG